MKLFRCILPCTLAICNGTTKLSCASRKKGRRDPIDRVPRVVLFPRHFCIVVDKVSEKTASRTSSPSPRATARVPTPLHTAPALTIRRGECRSFRPHCKGGGGVKRAAHPPSPPGR